MDLHDIFEIHNDINEYVQYTQVLKNDIYQALYNEDLKRAIKSYNLLNKLEDTISGGLEILEPFSVNN